MLAVQTILHPTDFSTQAQSALDVALALCRDYRARLILVHVKELPVVVSGEFGVLPPDPGEDRKLVQEKLSQMKRANESSVSKCILAEGDPATEIEAVAQSEHCDVIVMGTHGRSGLARLLMGSVAERVVRKAPCPVLTVKSPPETVAKTKKEAVALCP